MIQGKRVKITIPGAYPYLEENYYAEAICVDKMGTLTFRREEDGFLGIAGLGCWVILSS